MKNKEKTSQKSNNTIGSNISNSKTRKFSDFKPLLLPFRIDNIKGGKRVASFLENKIRTTSINIDKIADDEYCNDGSKRGDFKISGVVDSYVENKNCTTTGHVGQLPLSRYDFSGTHYNFLITSADTKTYINIFISYEDFIKNVRLGNIDLKYNHGGKGTFTKTVKFAYHNNIIDRETYDRYRNLKRVPTPREVLDFLLLFPNITYSISLKNDSDTLSETGIFLVENFRNDKIFFNKSSHII